MMTAHKAVCQQKGRGARGGREVLYSKWGVFSQVHRALLGNRPWAKVAIAEEITNSWQYTARTSIRLCEESEIGYFHFVTTLLI